MIVRLIFSSPRGDLIIVEETQGAAAEGASDGPYLVGRNVCLVALPHAILAQILVFFSAQILIHLACGTFEKKLAESWCLPGNMPRA